ncbi:MAG TPA: hypothetical protein ENK10_08435 [Acidobacteria bacterium]|nr:hypothetical protein [Acidobacteriota bacterium]
MYLTGIVHRDRLFEIATRWFAGRLEPGDGRFVTQVLIYENLISAPVARALLRDVSRQLGLGPVCVHRLRVKDELRQAIVASSTTPSPRQRELFTRYRQRPDDFFPGTPADVSLFTGEQGEIRGMIRVKRIRRVADKASRRVATALTDALRDAGSDFAAAEQRLGLALEDGSLRFEPEQLRIDDLIGLKLVGSESQLERFQRAIDSHPRVLRVQKEIHAGAYNDINLLVDIELPPPGEIIDCMRGHHWDFATGRGLDTDVLARDFVPYVESGARSVRAEVILTTFDELVESEFGRSMHEERILSQRNDATYTGRIARNASYLIEYLLRLAVSPTVEIDALPIRIGGRYLQETFSGAIWRLYGLRHDMPIFDSFATEPFS